MEPDRRQTGIPYPEGIGALIGGIVSGVYLLLASPELASGTVSFTLLIGLAATFIAATVLNSMVAAVLAIWLFKRTTGVRDYLAGAVIGSAVAYLTVIFYFFSLV